jgi:hypothetical protein
MEPIYSAGRQAWKVRLVQWIALACGPVALWTGGMIVKTYGLHPSEGGALAPLPLRLALGGFVAALGVSFVVGMWVYGRCYVMAAAVDETRGVLDVTLAGLLVPWRMEVPLDAVEGAVAHAGQLNTGGVSVNAPWTSVRLYGRFLPLVIDAQASSSAASWWWSTCFPTCAVASAARPARGDASAASRTI